MATKVYTPATKKLLDGDIDLLVDDIRVVLIDVADYTFSASHEFLSSVPSGARVGTPQTLSGKTTNNGTFDATDPVFPSVTGDPCEALLYYKHVTNDADSPLILYNDGKQTVTCAVSASGGATSIVVDALAENMASGTTLAFSGGTTATLSSGATAGARSVAVNALSGPVAANETAEGAVQNTGFPITPNGGNITVTLSSSGILRLVP